MTMRVMMAYRSQVTSKEASTVKPWSLVSRLATTDVARAIGEDLVGSR